jgi:hypothetical protein
MGPSHLNFLLFDPPLLEKTGYSLYLLRAVGRGLGDGPADLETAPRLSRSTTPVTGFDLERVIRGASNGAGAGNGEGAGNGRGVGDRGGGVGDGGGGVISSWG